MTPTPKSPDGALVLFSGGQDSTVCLAWALERYGRVETVGFDYGQRHGVEMQARQVVRDNVLASFPDWAQRLGPDHELDMRGFGAIGGSALTTDREIEINERGLPSTFVPGRNLVFLTYAAALADRRGLNVLIGGMCETDYSGYPDCRRETLDAVEKSLALGFDETFRIHTPLMHLDKAETWALASQLGGQSLVDLIISETVTCYHGDRSERRIWGYGCGQCPACVLRACGFEQWAARAK